MGNGHSCTQYFPMQATDILCRNTATALLFFLNVSLIVKWNFDLEDRGKISFSPFRY